MVGVTVPPPTPVAALCREYAALAATAACGLADLLDGVVALAVRTIPTARSARIHVQGRGVVGAGTDAPSTGGADADGVLAIPLVGRGELAGLLELAPRTAAFPAHERELAELLATLLTLSLTRRASA